MTGPAMFEKAALIGIGLIGGSLARNLRHHGMAREIVACARNEETRERALALGLCDSATADAAEAVRDADLVIICTPIGTYSAIGEVICPAMKPGAILTDVGSVKTKVVDSLSPFLKDGVHLVPGHPIAGTEHSGPDASFLELFQDRWAIVTPLPDSDLEAVAKVEEMWRRAGSMVERMTPDHHDQVLAITSHLPHLIAYCIVGTATDLGSDLQQEVIRYSASGFRDFTRIAASDPVMWRDIFLNNREAVMEVLGRFNEDLTALQRAIRRRDGDALEELFTRTRAIRRSIIDARQA
jgi:cyclohexadieny/prephenate dehydrogenase